MMETVYSVGLIKSIGANKKLGQNFLIDRSVAIAEAAHCEGKNVLELGAGLGMLTNELCGASKHVTAIEIDKRLYGFLKSNLKQENLELINGDFFKVASDKDVDILASNVPYNLSAKTLLWLVEHDMPAILCLQKEFVDRMTAAPGSRDYSRLSVFSTLRFRVVRLMNVPSSSFYPSPRVESSLIYLKPISVRIDEKEMNMLSLLMEHKNKKVRNALEDSSKALQIDKKEARSISDKLTEKDSRISKMKPEELLDVVRRIIKSLEIGKE